MRQVDSLRTRRQGTNVFYRVTTPKINRACDTIREALDQLQQKKEVADSLNSASIGYEVYKKCFPLFFAVNAVLDLTEATMKYVKTLE